DSITVDVTDLTADDLATGRADLLHDAYDIHSMAIDADTIGYELITQLGHRPARQYLGGPALCQPATP
ncbi:MAG: alanine racemase, partial [Candidatus Puniceispirillum sp.]